VPEVAVKKEKSCSSGLRQCLTFHWGLRPIGLAFAAVHALPVDEERYGREYSPSQPRRGGCAARRKLRSHLSPRRRARSASAI